jgi:hypothetical protein
MTSARKLKRRADAQIARHLLCSIALDVQADVIEVCVFEGRRSATLRLSLAKADAFAKLVHDAADVAAIKAQGHAIATRMATLVALEKRASTVTPVARTAGVITQAITGDGTTTTTLAREP